MEIEKLFDEEYVMLSGVGYIEEIDYDLHNGVVFILDDTYYVAYEDECDGYRSMAEIREMRPEEIEKVRMYEFPKQRVIVKQGDLSEYLHPETVELITIIDYVNHKPIIEVGTESYDDWYPTAIFNYMPENMHVNENR